MALVVGVAGGSGAGKSTLVQKLSESLGADGLRVRNLSLDSFFKPIKPKTLAPLSGKHYDDWNHPSSFDWKACIKEIDAASQGNDVVFIEGLLVLQNGEVRQRLHLKVYVDLAADERIVRRLRRNMQAKNLEFDEIAEYYLDSVRYRHQEFVEPSRWHADLLINGSHNEFGASLLALSVKQLVAKPELRPELKLSTQSNRTLPLVNARAPSEAESSEKPIARAARSKGAPSGGIGSPAYVPKRSLTLPPRRQEPKLAPAPAPAPAPEPVPARAIEAIAEQAANEPEQLGSPQECLSPGWLSEEEPDDVGEVDMILADRKSIGHVSIPNAQPFVQHSQRVQPHVQQFQPTAQAQAQNVAASAKRDAFASARANFTIRPSRLPVGEKPEVPARPPASRRLPNAPRDSAPPAPPAPDPVHVQLPQFSKGPIPWDPAHQNAGVPPQHVNQRSQSFVAPSNIHPSTVQQLSARFESDGAPPFKPGVTPYQQATPPMGAYAPLPQSGKARFSTSNRELLGLASALVVEVPVGQPADEMDFSDVQIATPPSAGYPVINTTRPDPAGRGRGRASPIRSFTQAPKVQPRRYNSDYD
jgi:uridine kinase